MVSIRRLLTQLQTISQTAHRMPQNDSNEALLPQGQGAGGIMNNSARSNLGNTMTLSLKQLSPRLSQMSFGYRLTADSTNNHASNTAVACIPLPGRFGVESAFLANRISVLPTKTKPKRLLMRTSSGHSYPYLLKGLEDLRLDVRIMRLFELTNLALIKTHGVHSIGQAHQLQARTYAVTPLGVRAGLLQMVQGAVPLFSLYKQWQLRMAKSSAGGGSPSTTLTPGNVPRPGDLFHSRLCAMMLAGGHQYRPQDRSAWPVDVVKQVFTSLQSETPPDLLSRELWASNPSCTNWWLATQTFARSTGAMSMLGYLVGLGDRHLDNLLVDLTTGHVIHIDYNICFDKGRFLRVPERVPFRLTRIIRHALGQLTSPEDTVGGTLRVAAEHTLTVARANSNALLIHLKSFLIDPLVNWQHKKHTGTTVTTATTLPTSITDIMYLSAYYGGGSSACSDHHVASCNRRMRRADAERRVCVGLLVGRLLELIQTHSWTETVFVLRRTISHLQVWSDVRKAKLSAQVVADYYSTLINTPKERIRKSVTRCIRSVNATKQLGDVQTELAICVENLAARLDRALDVLGRLQNTTGMVSFLAKVSMTTGASALSQYYAIARMYLCEQEQNTLLSLWTTQVHRVLMALRLIFVGSVSKSKLTHCRATIKEIVTVKEELKDASVFKRFKDAISLASDRLQRLQSTVQDASLNSYPDVASAVHVEIDQLKLFVYEQGQQGESAYCWSLLQHLIVVVGSVLSMETDPSSWSCDNSSSEKASKTPTSRRPTLFISQLAMFCDCLAALFGVLHQPNGAIHFTAGFEADVRRELAFLYAVRDATLRVSQLRSNLIRLLLPEAMDALACSSGELLEEVSSLVVRYMSGTDSADLKGVVNDFLTQYVVNNPNETRVHQVLFAAHLALVNTTAQMEETAATLRQCTMTAPAWYYVDVISQSVATLVSRSTDWRAGATKLWSFESPTTLPNGDPAPATGDLAAGQNESANCSWSEEIYASGFMAFVSVMEECRAHLTSVQLCKLDPIGSDLTFSPLADNLDRFIGRLTSRLGLASLIGLACSRLMCSLTEHLGVSLRRLLLEQEAAAAGMRLPVLSIAADKLVETIAMNLNMTQPVEMHHLHSSASTLINNLLSRANMVAEHLRTTFEVEVSERHLIYLQSYCTALTWLYPTQVLSTETERLSCGLPSLDALLLEMESTMQANVHESSVLSTSSSSTPSDYTLDDIIKTVCYFEKLRLR